MLTPAAWIAFRSAATAFNAFRASVGYPAHASKPYLNNEAKSFERAAANAGAFSTVPKACAIASAFS